MRPPFATSSTQSLYFQAPGETMPRRTPKIIAVAHESMRRPFIVLRATPALVFCGRIACMPSSAPLWTE
jgi:hypothetical protein